MIEDALKSTRILHRLLIGVSLAVLVFSLSIQTADQQRQYKEAIDRLLAIDFQAYQSWLDDALKPVIDNKLADAVVPLRESLNQSDLLIFGLESIPEELSQPVHIGQVLVEDLVLSDLSNATLAALDAVNGLSPDSDVQITVPDTELLTSGLMDWLNTEGRTGQRIDNVDSFLDFEFAATSFLPEGSGFAVLSFELHDPSTVASIPIYTGTFEYEVLTVENTALTDWVTMMDLGSDVVVDGSELRFLPQFTDLPVGYREMKLGELSLRLGDEIRKAGPDERSITILGTTVPGRLLFIAAPLVLAALTYYLMSHLSHLQHLAGEHRQIIISFSWLPINLHTWQIALGRYRLAGYWLETVITFGVLPIGALLCLYVKLGAFAHVHSGILLLMGVSIFLILFFCVVAVRQIQSIRHEIHGNNGVA